MPAHYVCLSDLHLGYEKSILNDPVAQGNLIDQIAGLCGGATDRLILNGDCFEGCVPIGAGEHDAAGFNPGMAGASRSFLQKFTDAIHATSLVLLWGNHDYCLWQKVAASCGVPTFTNDQMGNVVLKQDGHVLPGAEAFIDDVVGPAAEKFQRIRSAYPNYVLGQQWPFTVFHHGHLLDRLILGWLPAIDYLALKLVTGEGQPKVSGDGTETIESIHRKTEAFIEAMWKINSKPRAEEWAILRRLEDKHLCPFYPTEASPSSKEIPSSLPINEPQSSQLGQQVGWYLSTVALDPTTPAMLGDPKAKGFLVIGHDHNGGSEDVMGLDGHAWGLRNTGGWTSDRDETALHTHVLIHVEDIAEPSLFCIKA
jgi:UDP-2,3-diacylglucosamine pyrophosphatase LpxH